MERQKHLVQDEYVPLACAFTHIPYKVCIVDRIDKPTLIKCYMGFQILDIPQVGYTIKSPKRNAIGEYIKQEIRNAFLWQELINLCCKKYTHDILGSESLTFETIKICNICSIKLPICYKYCIFTYISE